MLNNNSTFNNQARVLRGLQQLSFLSKFIKTKFTECAKIKFFMFQFLKIHLQYFTVKQEGIDAFFYIKSQLLKLISLYINFVCFTVTPQEHLKTS